LYYTAALHRAIAAFSPAFSQSLVVTYYAPEDVAAAGQVDCTADDDADIERTTSNSETMPANSKYTSHSSTSQQQ